MGEPEKKNHGFTVSFFLLGRIIHLSASSIIIVVNSFTHLFIGLFTGSPILRFTGSSF